MDPPLVRRLRARGPSVEFRLGQVHARRSANLGWFDNRCRVMAKAIPSRKHLGSGPMLAVVVCRQSVVKMGCGNLKGRRGTVCKMRAVIITQARLGSSRLPRKVLLSVGGLTMLEHHVIRLRESGLPLCVATTTEALDDPIPALASALEVQAFRGSEGDVLQRFAGAAREMKADVVVRVTSDCPLIDGQLIRRGVEKYLAAKDLNMFLSNTVNRTYPRGFDFEIFSAASLYAADVKADQDFQREHVTPYIHSAAKRWARVEQLTRSEDASDLRVTLDTADDFRLIKKLIEAHGADSLSAEGIIELLRKHPEYVALNAHIAQKGLSD